MHERHVGDSSVENRITNGTAVLGSQSLQTGFAFFKEASLLNLEPSGERFR